MIYLDHAAGSPLRPEVRKIMAPWLDSANPSSPHLLGKQARAVIEEARTSIANRYWVQPEHVIFTSGGTESNNLAILGVARANKNKGKHIITTQVEHPSILESCKVLEKEGFEVSYLPVEKDGLLNTAELIKALRKDTILITLANVNNETGVEQNIIELAGLIRQKSKAFVHIDSCQAPTGPGDTVDLHTINGRKIGGPAGSGALIISERTTLAPLFHGGGQEQGLRSGSENTAAIVGLAQALEIYEAAAEHLGSTLLATLRKEIPSMTLNGHAKERVPQIINVNIPGIDARTLVVELSKKGIQISTGSACNTGTLKASHVLVAMGKTKKEALSSIRISLGRTNTEKDIDRFVKTLKETIEPLHKKKKEVVLEKVA